MLFRFLLLATGAAVGIAVVAKSVPAALVAGVLGVLAYTYKDQA